MNPKIDKQAKKYVGLEHGRHVSQTALKYTWVLVVLATLFSSRRASGQINEEIERQLDASRKLAGTTGRLLICWQTSHLILLVDI